MTNDQRFGPFVGTVIGTAAGVLANLCLGFERIGNQVRHEAGWPYAITGGMIGFLLGWMPASIYRWSPRWRRAVEIGCASLLLGLASAIVGWRVGDHLEKNPPPSVFLFGLLGLAALPTLRLLTWAHCPATPPESQRSESALARDLPKPFRVWLAVSGAIFLLLSCLSGQMADWFRFLRDPTETIEVAWLRGTLIVSGASLLLGFLLHMVLLRLTAQDPQLEADFDDRRVEQADGAPPTENPGTYPHPPGDTAPGE